MRGSPSSSAEAGPSSVRATVAAGRNVPVAQSKIVRLPCAEAGAADATRPLTARSPRKREVESSVRNAASRILLSGFSSNFFSMWGGVMQLMQRHWFVNMETLHQNYIMSRRTSMDAIKQRSRDYLPEVESVKPSSVHGFKKITERRVSLVSITAAKDLALRAPDRCSAISLPESSSTPSRGFPASAA